MSTKIIRVYIVFAFTRDKIENHFERGQLPLQTQKWKFFYMICSSQKQISNHEKKFYGP